MIHTYGMMKKLIPEDRGMFWIGIGNLALGLHNLVWPSQFDTPLWYYLKFSWLVSGVVFLYRSYTTAR